MIRFNREDDPRWLTYREIVKLREEVAALRAELRNSASVHAERRSGGPQ